VGNAPVFLVGRLLFIQRLFENARAIVAAELLGLVVDRYDVSVGNAGPMLRFWKQSGGDQE